MEYSLKPTDVKKVIDAYLNDKISDKEQFLFYHLHRNFFNVKNEVTTLTKTGKLTFQDNLGHVWEEQSTFKNFFHMSTGNWVGSMVGVSSAESRKFLRDDTDSGLNGEFEMIVRSSDGKRIDALTHEEYQETYNFGRTRNSTIHKKLDVDTHRANGKYTFKMDMGKIKIIE